jgi:hypothetical protein
MKIVKFLVLFIILVLLALGGGWYYVTFKVAHKLNEEYAGTQMPVKGIDKEDYFVAFDQVNPSGFPYKISWKVSGWKEESRTAKIIYHSPIYFGYDLLLQKLFINYDGEITALYKPEERGFGAKLNIKDYAIKVDLPLNSDLISTLQNMKDPFEIVNHLGDIHASSKSVEIFDLTDNEKFYDKEYEKLHFTFVRQKEYKDVQDFLSNIPQHYSAKYLVKTKPNSAKTRRLPVSLFYGFSLLPSGFDVDANIVIKTQGNNFKEINRGLDIQLEAECASPFVNFSNAKLKYKFGIDKLGQDFQIDMGSKIFFKKGMFDELFHRYDMLSEKLKNSAFGKIVDKEIRYVIANKEVFKFTELENQNYDYSFVANSSNKKGKRYLKIDDLSIFSATSGFKLKHEMESSPGNNMDWNANGVLFLKNYPAVVEFSSGYIYRFGKFKFLSDEARSLYVDVNKNFLKNISDHPDSKSNDLSFEYSANSKNLHKTKVGSVSFDQIPRLYTLMLYKKLFDKVGHGDDVLGRMKKLIPDLDENEPLLKQILPKISGNKSLEKSIQKQLEKAVPKEAQDKIKKIIPKGLGKDLLKGLL